MVAWSQIQIRDLYNTKQRSNDSNATLYCCTTYSGIQMRLSIVAQLTAGYNKCDSLLLHNLQRDTTSATLYCCTTYSGIQQVRLSIVAQLTAAYNKCDSLLLHNLQRDTTNATLYCCTTYSWIQQRNGDDIGTILACRFILYIYVCVCVCVCSYFFIRAGTKMRSAEQIHLTFSNKEIIIV
jgi:hypothetical protein